MSAEVICAQKLIKTKAQNQFGFNCSAVMGFATVRRLSLKENLRLSCFGFEKLWFQVCFI